MKTLFKFIFCWLLLLVGVTACQKDDTTVAIPIEPDFVATASDGTELKNASDAMDQNIFSVGDVITFQNRSTGAPKSITWVLDNGSFQKTVTADSEGAAVYALMIAGEYDITMYADDEELTFTSYLQVVGGTTPGAVDVEPAFTATFGGVELTQENDALNTVTTGATLTLTDTSSSQGFYETVKWIFTNTSDASDYFEVEAEQGKSVDCTLPSTAGTYNVTMYASADELTYTKYIKISTELMAAAGYDCSFEDSTKGSWCADMWWGDNFKRGTVLYSTAMAYTGSQSTCFDVQSATADVATSVMVTAHRDASNTQLVLSVESGVTYNINFKMYITSMCTTTYPSIDCGLEGHSPTWAGDSAKFFDASTPMNEWFDVTLKVTATSNTAAELVFRVPNNTTSGTNFKFYMDDISMTVDGDDSGSTDSGTDDSGSTTTPSGDDMLSAAGISTGFEDMSNLQMANLGAWWGSPWNTYTFDVAQSSAQKYNGSNSLLFNVSSGEQIITAFRDSGNLQFPVGFVANSTYDVSFYLYIESMDSAGSPSVSLDLGSAAYDATQSLSGLSTGAWNQVTIAVTSGSTITEKELQFMITNTSGSSALKIYIDDVSMVAQGGGSSGDDTTDDDTTGGSTSGGTNLLSAAGYEVGFEDSSKFSWLQQTWMSDWSSFVNPVYSTAQANTGTGSSYVELPGGSGLLTVLRGSTTDEKFTLGISYGKTYTLEFYVYIPSANSNATEGCSVTCLFEGQPNSTTWGQSIALSDLAQDQWVKVSTTMAVEDDSDATSIFLVANNTTSTTSFNFYIDDLSLTEDGATSGGDSSGDSSGSTTTGTDLLSAAGISTGFEDWSNLTMSNLGAWWGSPWDTYTFDVAQSSAQKYNGSYSLKVNVLAGEAIITSMREGNGNYFPIGFAANTTHDVTFYLYIESMDGSPSITLDLGSGSYSASKSLSGMSTGVWTEVTIPVTSGSTTVEKDLQFMISNTNASSALTIYIDDVSMVAQSSSSSGDSSSGGSTSTGENLLSKAGYEVGFEDSSKFSWLLQTWMSSWGVDVFVNPVYSTAQANTGTGSSYVELPGGKGLLTVLRGPTTSEVYPLEISYGKTYTLEFYIYIPSGNSNADTGCSIVCLFEGQPNSTTWGQSIALYDLARDQWVKVSTTMAVEDESGANSIFLVSNNTSVGTSFNYYIDDLSLTEN
ncbi:MAG: hypothetical protein SNH01_06950 [Rikenellaceae bacterium]